MRSLFHPVILLWVTLATVLSPAWGQSDASDPVTTSDQTRETTPVDPMREMQLQAVIDATSSWAHWGNQPSAYSTWTNHSNRLIPVYTFGITLDRWRQQGSPYADPERLKELYGRVPEGSVNPTANYHDQTDIYRLQQHAVEKGYKRIILMVFDGMDWQTTRAAALYEAGEVSYRSGRGSGLSFLDDRRVETDFGLVVTSPKLSRMKTDVDAQTTLGGGTEATGGYDVSRGGAAPWLEQSRRDYLLGLDRQQPHSVTDSASSATSLTSGIKTYNGAINVTADGTQVVPIARELQQQHGFKIGVVTSVPVSHATPAAAYANNVTRKDYQDLTRDLIGLPSSAHRREPLPGVDVLIGAGWGEIAELDKQQGNNYAAGNKYLHEEDLQRVSVEEGGPYVVAQRREGVSGNEALMQSAERAAQNQHRLLGFYGVGGGHLPFRTADGRYNPTADIKGTETYSPADVQENPTLAEMTRAALHVLQHADQGFWLLVEAGDVDWANHANNVDSSIGAVHSGDEAFRVVMDWVDQHGGWADTAVIVTADHGHFLVIDDDAAIAQAGRKTHANSLGGPETGN